VPKNTGTGSYRVRVTVGSLSATANVNVRR
jgi:hypothetical protein